MTLVNQFTLWPRLPSELKNEIICRFDPKTVVKFAQTSNDSLKRVDYLLATNKAQKIVVSTLCVKSGHTDRVYLEYVQHDGNRHTNEDLKVKICSMCLTECVHYHNEFNEHRLTNGNCRTTFTQTSIAYLPRALQSIHVLDTVVFVNIKYSLHSLHEMSNDDFALPNKKFFEIHKMLMINNYYGFNYETTPLLSLRAEAFHYEEMLFDNELKVNVRYQHTLNMISIIDIKSRIFEDISCLQITSHNQIKPVVEESELAFKSPNLYKFCVF